MMRLRLAFSVLVISSAGFAGCKLGEPSLVRSPYSYDEQVSEIVKIAPLGTERAEAVRRLEAAGITGEFSAGQSTYYCKLWRREEGKRWQLDVAILFNEEGKLYGTRHGDTETKIERAGAQSSNVSASPAQGSGNSTAVATPPTSAPQTATSVRSGPRSPF